MLRDRIQSSFVIAALVAAAYWLPPGGILLVLLAVCAVVQWEFYSLFDAAGIPHFKYVGLAGGLALIAATGYSFLLPARTVPNAEVMVLLAVTVLVLLRQFPQKHNPRPLETMAGTLLGVMYVPFLFNFVTKLLMGWGGAEGRLLVFYLIVVVKTADIGAYAVGCSIGRHKLFPRVSPLKTWEGFIGGALSAVAASVLFFAITKGNLGVVKMGLADAVILGAVLAVAGTLSDLTESLCKRAAGVKDSGHIIQGMGGLLDVVDSLLLTAPVLYVYARYFLESMQPILR